MKDHEQEPVASHSRDGALEAIGQTIIDPALTVSAARELAQIHPDYAKDARQVAFEAFPDDKAKREAFLSGTEFPFLLKRQADAARELEFLFEGEPETAVPTRKLKFGGRLILALTIMFRQSGASRGGGV